MLPDRVSNPGPLTYESGALPIALRGPATWWVFIFDLDLYFTVHICICGNRPKTALHGYNTPQICNVCKNA